MFLKSLILASLLTSSFSAYGREYPISSGRSVNQRADSLFEMVSKELVFTNKKQFKFKAIQMTTTQLEQLARGEEVSAEQKTYVAEYVAALKSLPVAKTFKKSRCDDYEVTEKAKNLLASLCDRDVALKADGTSTSSL